MVLIYNVFGRHIGVKREGGRWLVFRAGLTERKFSRLYDVAIPDNMTEDEILGWLGDIFHEAATERHPDVKRIE